MRGCCLPLGEVDIGTDLSGLGTKSCEFEEKVVG